MLLIKGVANKAALARSLFIFMRRFYRGNTKAAMGTTVKSQSQKQVLLLGAGYTAKALIPALLSRGYSVSATSRKPNALAGLGVTPILFDTKPSPEVRQAVSKAHIILSSIPPVNGRDPVVQAFSGVFSQHAPNLEWAGYLSATSVYGDRGGRWVFENEILKPGTQRGKNRVEAELDWMESGAPVHIFRLAGIYGPGRNPFGKLRDGEARATIKPEHIVNRIHVDDIVSAILAAIDKPDPMRAFNIADGTPAPPQDVLDFAADLIGANRPPRIPLDTADISPMARSFYKDNKRVSNALAKATFGWVPQYPDYKTGLKAVLAAETKL